MSSPQTFDPRNLPPDVKPLVDRLFNHIAHDTDPDWEERTGGGQYGPHEETRVAIVRLDYPEEYARAAADWAMNEGNKVWQQRQRL